ncbi:glycogen/starch synthase [Streptomyces fradiae]|uniref:glycogen synthase n=1 Tax=Streptomyces fradiae TaxID=1906 RepID=UPI0020185F03|nr:glycogen/starch synthase [Streptomyces fradiae]UQS29231.1 glycogen/starch synthase [Streptomyces fradiae]
MRCLYLVQELASYFAEGGLGQAARALPELLQRDHGIEHDLLVPYYPWLVAERGLRTEEVARLPGIRIAGVTAEATVERVLNHDGSCDVFLLRADVWYDREGIYRDGRYVEFADATARAAFFGWAAARWAEVSGRTYDLVHGNDWQSGAALAHLRRARGSAARPALLMNVHNGAYAGEVGVAEVAGLGLPDAFREPFLTAARGRPSLLLAGLLAADAATTGSPGYARELRAELAGSPLGDVLEPLALTGIVAGVDERVWNPAAPGRLATPFDRDAVTPGKRANKRALQHLAALREDPDVPLFGVCARLVPEKGVDLMLTALGPRLLDGTAQLVVVGSGDTAYTRALAELRRSAPGAVHHLPRFDHDVASLVYAGSDFTLMPSRVEPCGLNQLIAMAYATVPLVSAVGGLRDTVSELRGAPQEGTGFRFAALTAQAVEDTVADAVRWLGSSPGEVERTRRRLMDQDWTWHRTARETARLYEQVVAHD